MTKRLASLALALTLAVPASSAFAQGYGAPRYDAPAQQSRSILGMPAWVLGDQEDGVTTGSIAPRRGYDSSAKAGNAAQPDRRVPQYGNTAGGPAE